MDKVETPTDSTTSSIVATYQVSATAAEVERVARFIALEQTVEVPESLIANDPAAQAMVGQVSDLAEVGHDLYRVKIAFDVRLASGQIPQLLNLVFGNISLRNDLRLLDLALPESFLARFAGPRHGIQGIRERLGVFGRPLIASALKPRSASNEHLAEVAHEFALGGGDIIKDDHNLVDEDLGAFVARVETCQKAVDKANRQTGFNTLYFPNVCVPADRFTDSLEALVSMGVSGVMLAPLLLGLDSLRSCAERFGLLQVAHPTFTGTFFHDPAHGMEPSLMLGTLFRLAGADMSIYPNSGGRFGFSAEQCAGIADKLTTPLGRLAQSLPMPAGGMQVSQIGNLALQYGADVGLLFGGSLLGDPLGVRRATAKLLEGLASEFSEVRRTPLTA